MGKLGFIPFSRLAENTKIDLYNKVYEDYYFTAKHNFHSYEKYEKTLPISNKFSQVITYKNTPIGLAIISTRGKRSWISAFGLLKEHRQMGYGKILLDNVIKRLKLAGMSDIGLEVLASNKIAYNLYKQAGFSMISELTTLKGEFNRAPREYSLTSYDYNDISHLISIQSDTVWSRRLDSLRDSKYRWIGINIEKRLKCLICCEIDSVLYIKRVEILSGDRNDLRKLYISIANNKCFPEDVFMVNYLAEEEEIIKTATDCGLEKILTQYYLKLILR